jgi:diguanylate cyclase (GGDEF)-like protein
LRGYAVASLALIAAHPFLPDEWGDASLVVAITGAAACVVYGRRAVRPEARRAWTLLLCALGVVAVGNLVPLVAGQSGVAAGWLLDAVGNLLVLAAGLALIARHQTRDLGGVIDAAVIALAAGSLLWVLLPHGLGSDHSFPAQLNLFVVVFALTGVLGALMRLVYTAEGTGFAAWWLIGAIGLAIAGNVVLSLAGTNPVALDGATTLFIASLTATGLFGLDPSAPRLAYVKLAHRDQLSVRRLVSLAVAVAVIPVAIGLRDVIAGDVGGVLLAIQGSLVAVGVMARVGILAAQCTRAEQALEHQATHDPLTHLPNRREFFAQLRHHLGRGARCVLLFCDLDNFKMINDRYGHDTGDALLVEVARRLVASIGPRQLACRFGGDEFVVLLVDATPAEIEASRARIVHALQRPFEQAEAGVIGVSIGVAEAGDDRDPEHLIKTADRAMYRAKPSRTRDRAPLARPSASPVE